MFPGTLTSTCGAVVLALLPESHDSYRLTTVLIQPHSWGLEARPCWIPVPTPGCVHRDTGLGKV